MELKNRYIIFAKCLGKRDSSEKCAIMYLPCISWAINLRKRLRESSRLQAGDESRHHFPFWLSMYFLTVSADILPTDPM